MTSDMRTVHFRVVREKEKSRLGKAIVSSLHFQNILILLLKENYAIFKSGKAKNYHNDLLNKRIMRAVISGAKGGKNHLKVQEIRQFFAKNSYFIDLLKIGSTLKEKNIAQLIAKLKAAYNAYFTKIKNGDTTAKPPGIRKLRKIINFSIPIDQSAFSLSKKRFIRINLGKKMESFHFDHEKLLKVVGDLKNIQSVEVLFKHEEIYISVTYHRNLKTRVSSTKTSAGLDLGVTNLASIFIDDASSSSLVLSGKNLIAFNNQNNIRIARAKSKERLLENELTALRKILENGHYRTEEDLEKNQEYADLKRRWVAAKRVLSQAYLARHSRFKDIFHKASVRILEILEEAQVDTLFVSRNLGEAKQAKGFSKKFNKKFHQIPLIKLIDYLQMKGGEFGIRVENVDEAYTSKTSCLSGNVGDAQKFAAVMKQDNKALSREKRRQRLSNALMGVRESRSVYRDRVLGKRILADLNAACNHIRVGDPSIDFSWLKGKLWKLTRPVLVYPDSLLLDLCLTGTSELRDPLRISYAAKLRKNLFRQV